MVKTKIVQAFLEYNKKCDAFTDRLPSSVQQFLLENELNTYNDEIIHTLLAQIFTTEELDDLYYFAYETNPKVLIDDLQFDNLLDFWAYLDSTKKN